MTKQSNSGSNRISNLPSHQAIERLFESKLITVTREMHPRDTGINFVVVIGR